MKMWKWILVLIVFASCENEVTHGRKVSDSTLVIPPGKIYNVQLETPSIDKDHLMASLAADRNKRGRK